MRCPWILLAPFSLLAVACAMPSGPGPAGAGVEAGRLLRFGLDGTLDDASAPALGLDYVSQVEPPERLDSRLAGELEVIVDPDSPRAWWRFAGAGGLWDGATATGAEADEAAARLFPVVDDVTDVPGFAIVHDGLAWLPSEDTERLEPLPLEVAPGSALLPRVEAWEATGLLRSVGGCPATYARCLLFGRWPDVSEVVDPTVPVGGWSLERLAPPAASHAPAWEHSGPLPGAPGLAVAFAEPAAPSAREGDEDVFLSHDAPGAARVTLLRGGVETLAFDLPTSGDYVREEGAIVAGVARDGARLVVWAWLPDAVLLAASMHDAVTGERLGDPVIVAGVPSFDVECGNVFLETRPMPVLDGERLRVALYWGGGEALLFDRPGESGRFVAVAGGEDSYEPTDPGVPPFFVYDGADALR